MKLIASIGRDLALRIPWIAKDEYFASRVYTGHNYMRTPVLLALLLVPSSVAAEVAEVPIHTKVDLKPGETRTFTFQSPEQLELGWNATLEHDLTTMRRGVASAGDSDVAKRPHTGIAASAEGDGYARCFGLQALKIGSAAVDVWTDEGQEARRVEVGPHAIVIARTFLGVVGQASRGVLMCVAVFGL
jgi:hypothetical protein